MAKEIATKTKLDTRIAADIAAAMPVASKPVAAKAALASELAKKAIVIESEEVQAAVEQTVEGSADVIVAQAAGAAASSGAAAGGAAAGMSTTALVVAGVAVAAAASSSSSSSPAPAPAATTPTTTTTPVAGQTFTLTDKLDNLTGGAGNDKFIADAATATTSDQINGGDGTDTLVVYDAAGIADIPTLTSVENLELVGLTSTTDFTARTGITTLTLDDPTTGQTHTVAGTTAVVYKNVAAAETNDLAYGSTVTAANVTVTKYGTSTGNATLDINGTLNVLQTLNLTASGTASYVTLTDTTAVLKTVNVAGDVNLTLTSTEPTGVTNYNASGFTGALTLDVGASGGNTTITGGAGADTITAVAAVNYTINAGAGNDTVITSDAAGELTSADSIVGGDGTDTIGVGSAEAADLDDNDTADNAVLAKISGFEQMRITDDLAADFNIARWGYNYLQLAGDTDNAGADVTVSGFTSGATIELREAANMTSGVIVTMTGASDAGTNSDVFNIKLNADLTEDDALTSGFSLAGINIVNIQALDRGTTPADTDGRADDGYVVDLADGTAANSASIKTINITGTQEVTITQNAATVALETVNAADSTGDFIFSGAAHAGTQGLTITSGAGRDALTGSDLADLISGGAGNDTITGGDGSDIMTGGAGADTFVFAAGSLLAAPSASVFETITDFAKSSDIIDFDQALTIGASSITAAVAGTAAINTSGKATFAAADDTLAEKVAAVAAGIVDGTDADGDFAFFEHDGSTYVFLDSSTTDAIQATDVLIKLTGVTDVTAATISSGNITLA